MKNKAITRGITKDKNIILKYALGTFDLSRYSAISEMTNKEANMGIVSDIKQELRKVEAYKINYTTRKAVDQAQVFENMN